MSDFVSDEALNAMAFAFVTESRSQSSVPSLAAALQAIIEPLGITAAASGFVSGPKAASGQPFHFTNWSEAWIKLYMESDFLLIDPLPRWARSSGRALTWSALINVLPVRDPGRVVVAAAAQFGYLEGMAIPMRGVDNALGLVAMGGARQSLRPAEQTFLTIVGRAAFEAAERIEQGPEPGQAAPILTAREIECLALLVRGHSDREMGAIMGVSEPTVRFHLLNARNKYSAASRTHLAALAVTQGYVTL